MLLKLLVSDALRQWDAALRLLQECLDIEGQEAAQVCVCVCVCVCLCVCVFVCYVPVFLLAITARAHTHIPRRCCYHPQATDIQTSRSV